jgi:polysaccharide pyruvyl transferase WcaK-like protein
MGSGSHLIGTRAIQICNGLGAGNIGDELMARAFWDALAEDICLEVEIFPNEALAREPYPSRHRYIRLAWDGSPCAHVRARPGLLVGDTPVTETLGVDWPLRFLGPRLEAFHRSGQPVDALGVGVERLRSDEARSLFRRHYLPIRSWTVRTTSCRDALLELGVAENRVALGADWAWLYRARRDLRAWGAATWREVGIDPTRPLIVVNVVNEIWRQQTEMKQALAAALDTLATEASLQVAFFCQEMREGDFFDLAAARETASHMRRSGVIVPNLYYSPDEVLGLLAHASATVAGRYHFVVASVLAGTVPVCLVRSQKMDGLLADLDLPPAGAIDHVSPEALVSAARSALHDREALCGRLQASHRRIEARAQANLSLWSLHSERTTSPRTRA